MKELNGKVAVVTGAASGIGKSLAISFAQKGMKVVAADVDSEGLETVRNEIQQAGGQCHVRLTDVSQPEEVIALADEAWQTFGGVHVLCNNAGVSAGAAPIHEAPLADWQWVMGVNFWGVVHGLAAFVPRMIEQGESAHIVNTASMAGMMVMPNIAPYVASKFAVVGITEALEKEMEPYPIGVSVLCPFWVDTGIFDSERSRPSHLRVEREHQDLKEKAKSTPISWLSPEQVSEKVLDAIESDRLYIFTHKETEAIVEHRFQTIRQDFPKL